MSVKRNAVFVDGYGSFFQGLFGLLAIHAFGEDVDQKEMIVGSSRNDPKSLFFDGLSQGLGIADDLLLISLECL